MAKNTKNTLNASLNLKKAEGTQKTGHQLHAFYFITMLLLRMWLYRP